MAICYTMCFDSAGNSGTSAIDYGRTLRKLRDHLPDSGVKCMKVTRMNETALAPWLHRITAFVEITWNFKTTESSCTGAVFCDPE